MILVQEPATIPITLNGEPRDIPLGTTINGLFALLGLSPVGLLVERNKTVVHRSAFATEQFEPGDTVELMRLIGGG